MFETKKVCPICLKVFTGTKPNSKYCDFCKKNRPNDIKEYVKAEYLKKQKMKKVPKESLTQVLRDLEAYNKKHGTHLTYGKYVQMKTLGQLEE